MAIGYLKDEFILPPIEGRQISNRLLEELTAIKNGEVEDKHNWLYAIALKKD
jgi:branched-chain amino acid aminotransferase